MEHRDRGLLGYATRWGHARRSYVRKYPANTRWNGYLSSIAIDELERFGNTVTNMGDGSYILNATEAI